MKKVMVTCYDASFARLIAESGSVDYVLVGDSLGMVIDGKSDTHSVTQDQMVRHVEAVKRGLTGSGILLVADMVKGSESTSKKAIRSAQQLIAAGADLVKIEGPQFEQVEAMTRANIRVVGHLGLTPQFTTDYKVQAREPAEAEKLLEDAERLQNAGAELLVLEMIPTQLAKKATEALKIPTIGIGAGPHCAGQVLVLYDLLGLNPSFHPKFLKTYADGAGVVTGALKGFSDEVRSGKFPSRDQSFV